ncbi:MAG: hypothetical protein ABR608_04255 [Pseudonocardiaceae bacterium]
MPVAMRPWLWGLSAVLLLGLVLMHHAPGYQEHHDGPAVAHSVLVSSGSEVADPSGCPCPADTRSPVVPDLLHLCLAVMVSAILLLAPLLLGLSPSPPAGAPGQWVRSALDFLRPPPPVPRRLAALGVLRR